MSWPVCCHHVLATRTAACSSKAARGGVGERRSGVGQKEYGIATVVGDALPGIPTGMFMLFEEESRVRIAGRVGCWGGICPKARRRSTLCNLPRTRLLLCRSQYAWDGLNLFLRR